MPVVVQPQGLGQIAGGTNTIWNNAPAAAPAAARTDALLADIAAMRTGDPQGGYGALPPAIPASGAHYSAPGAYEGYMDYGFPPVMYQRSPYATAAYRTYRSPFGQLGVQPQIGFASAYPHVIQYPGDNPFREMPNLLSLAQALWSSLPMPPSMPMRGGMGVGRGAPGGTAPNKTAPNTQPTRPPMVGNPDVEAQDHSYVFVGPERPAAPAQPAGNMDYPWYYYSATGEALPNKMGFNNWPQEAGNAVWDWLSGAGKPTPDELNAAYNAELQEQALTQQNGAVMRAAQEAIPLTQIAAPSGMQAPQGRVQLPPVSASLYDAVNTPRNAVLDAMRR